MGLFKPPIILYHMFLHFTRLIFVLCKQDKIIYSASDIVKGVEVYIYRWTLVGGKCVLNLRIKDWIH